jgi:DNA-binding XRE family transcriptional regulator
MYRNMRYERLKHGWTQKYVGEQIGVNKQAICDLEAGRSQPSYSLLVKLEDLFCKGHRELMQFKE